MTGIRDVEKLFLYARSDCPKQPLGVIGRDEAVIITVTDQDGAGNPSNGIHGANRSRIIPSPNADQGSHNVLGQRMQRAKEPLRLRPNHLIQ